MLHAASPVVLFDGVCNFCNDAVNFLLRQDVTGQLRYAALQSASGQQLLQQHGLPLDGFESFALVTGGKLYQKSGAALRLLPYLPWYWQWARAGWVIPKGLRDGVYNLIAKNRYRWFGKRDACMIPAPEQRSRFLV